MTALAETEVDALVASLLTDRPDPDEFQLPSSSYPGLTVDDGYRVQRAVARRRERDGALVAGWKVGLVDPTAQAALGVSQPIAGRLYETGMLAEDGHVEAVIAGEGRIECEFAFLLTADLVGPGVTGAHVLQATAGVSPAFELLEERLPATAGVADMIADNCSGAGFVLGSALVPPGELDLATTGVILEVDGRFVGSGASGAVMGNPVRAVAWLADRLAITGERLRAGQVVLTGATIPPIPVDLGRLMVARFGGGLGSIRVRGTA